MAKYTSKPEFIACVEETHAEFLEIADSIPSSRYGEPGVWGDAWTIKDLFAHLTEWEQMFLTWFRSDAPVLPAPGYKWNETRRLNRDIWKKHARTSWKRVRESFDGSYAEMLELMKGLSETQLLTPGHFAWTKKHPLTTYLGPNTCNHYRVATKILKRWKREGQ